MTGKAGSGKSSSLAQLFEMNLKSRVSTGVMEGAITGIRPRDIGLTSFIKEDKKDKWIRLTHNIIRHILDAIRIKVDNVSKIAQKILEECQDLQLTPTQVLDIESESQAVRFSNTDSSSSTNIDAHVQETSQPKPSQEMPSFKEEQLQYRLTKESPTVKNVLRLNMIHFIDSGGQSQFHEVLPAFIHRTAIIVIVIKLNECLDDRLPIEFCDENGKVYKEEVEYLLSNHEIIEHQARTLQAKQAKLKSRAKIVVIGTHRDKEEECTTETRTQKNKKLYSMFEQLNLLDQLISYKSPEVIFPVNMLNPNDADKEVLGVLRDKIMNVKSPYPEAKVPCSWFALEEDIRKLSESNCVKVVSVAECEKIAKPLHIDSETLEASLLYYNSLNKFLYCPKILPGVLFVEPQVLLNCVLNFVKLQFKVSHKEEMGLIEEHARLLKEGVMTLEFIKEHSFESFVPPLFTAEHALKLFRSLFLVADIGKGKFLMPFLLPFTAKEELMEYKPSTNSPPTLLVVFKTLSESESESAIVCVPNGVFCASVASLILKYNWRHSKHNTMKRNIATLTHKFHPMKVTFVNMQSFLEIYIELLADEEEDDLLPKLCHLLQKMIFESIKEVLEVFKYVDLSPEKAFHCPQCSDKQAAVLIRSHGKTYLKCTHDEDHHKRLPNEHNIWDGRSSSKDTGKNSGKSVCLSKQ